MSNKPILIVDDNIDNLDLARMLLELGGHQVQTAEDAEKALTLLGTFHPALILMDIQLPGMDGLTLTSQLRQDPQYDDTVIVALTAYAMRGDEQKARQAGCDGYICKPINTRTFCELVQGYLNTPVSRHSK